MGLTVNADLTVGTGATFTGWYVSLGKSQVENTKQSDGLTWKTSGSARIYVDKAAYDADKAPIATKRLETYTLTADFATTNMAGVVNSLYQVIRDEYGAENCVDVLE